MSGATAGRSAGADDHKGRIVATKVKRYRPGQVPDWMKTDEAEEDEDGDTPLAFVDRQRTSIQTQPPPPPAGEEEKNVLPRRTGIAPPVIVKRADDPRLARLAAAAAAPPVDREVALRERQAARGERDVAAPEIVRRRERLPPPSASESESEEEEEGREGKCGDEISEEMEIAARRAAVRARFLQEEEERAAADEREKKESGAAVAEEDESEEEESSEYESDSEEDGGGGGGYFGHKPLAKPVFVPRVSRETIAEREALAAEEAEAADRHRLRLEQRKVETKELLAARLAEEEAQEAAAAAGPQGAEDIVTDDEAEAAAGDDVGVDADEEYQLWRLREMKRIGRDREQREREARELVEKERWKNMSEEERIDFLAEEKRKNGTTTTTTTAQEKPSKQWGFLQKYYHRGAFFQTEAEWKGEEAPLADVAAKRDFSAPTGADRVDRSTLPEVMQVKNFGRRGRSKWTHLAAEDTTDFSVPWAVDPKLRKNVERKLAGTEQVFTKPKNTKT